MTYINDISKLFFHRNIQIKFKINFFFSKRTCFFFAQKLFDFFFSKSIWFFFAQNLGPKWNWCCAKCAKRANCLFWISAAPWRRQLAAPFLRATHPTLNPSLNTCFRYKKFMSACNKNFLLFTSHFFSCYIFTIDIMTWSSIVHK